AGDSLPAEAGSYTEKGVASAFRRKAVAVVRVEVEYPRESCMAVIKKSVRKKLSKLLERLVKKHGAEMTLALVTGIVSSLAADQQAKADRKAGKSAKPDKRG